jgi:hypothetical protein
MARAGSLIRAIKRDLRKRIILGLNKKEVVVLFTYALSMCVVYCHCLVLPILATNFSFVVLS